MPTFTPHLQLGVAILRVAHAILRKRRVRSAAQRLHHSRLFTPTASLLPVCNIHHRRQPPPIREPPHQQALRLVPEIEAMQACPAADDPAEHGDPKALRAVETAERPELHVIINTGTRPYPFICVRTHARDTLLAINTPELGSALTLRMHASSCSGHSPCTTNGTRPYP